MSLNFMGELSIVMGELKINHERNKGKCFLEDGYIYIYIICIMKCIAYHIYLYVHLCLHNSKQQGALFVRSSNHNKFVTQTVTQSDSNQYA